ncbi:hypothetical protein [Nocardioides sp. W7]|uniref:hypothetical protein n=1 Tax=Nocardioides sp. W7 TaxID=2931390 RepID=UPI001FD5D296|nr:hypothetical protein [Nocardioides sp. W7]
MTHRPRIVALTLLLGGVALPAVAASPAQAEPGCLHDVSVVPIFAPGGCDDTTPPETAIGTTAPRLGPGGWVNKHTLRVGLSGHHTDADTDPIALECSLALDPAPPTEDEWSDCPTDGVFRGLTTTSVPYVLWVRAVDSADAAIAWSDGDLLNGFGDESAGDHDVSPARLAFQVDTVAPDTLLSGTPKDRLRPTLPMVSTASPRFRLAATETATFRCTVNGAAAPCAGGVTTLRSLRPGDQELRVQAVDPAGNVDPTPATTRFAVPMNLAPRGRAPGWKLVRRGGYLGGDYLQASTRGARLVVGAGRFRELRLLAATGPRAGVVELRYGGKRQRVDLRRAAARPHDQLRLRDERATPQRGRIEIRVLRGPVRLDGILAH